MAIERTLPMKVHKRIIINHLTHHPEDREQIIPGWPGTVEEYISELRRRPGEFFVDGTLETPEARP